MPTPRSVADIKSKLLRPALTSHFEVQLSFPQAVRSYLGVNQDNVNLSCCEASLPGSQLATLENNNDRTGVTEKHAYRRQFDDRIDLTFYVDAQNYTAIRFFEGWISFIMNENQDDNPFSAGTGPTQDQPPNLASREYNYRVKYPNDYIADQGLKVIKFERDYQQQLTYEFIRSFPLSISSMPVSFDASSLLKVTVSMSYIRYIVLKTPTKTGTQGPPNPANILNPSSQAQANSNSLRNVFGNNLPLGANDQLRSIQSGLA
jgi:hypothetical protein